MSRTAADASVFHAIADPTRRAVLDLLREGAAAVSALLGSLDVSQSALSQHLSVLRRAGLVRAEKRGRQRLYSVRAEPLREVADWIAHYDRFWSEKLDNLGRYLERTHGPPRSGPTRK